jgi:glycosyltransferase involved in cell wall biosynthesis
MSRLIRSLEPDIVHTHIFHSVLIGRIAAWIARVPIRVAMIPGPYHLEVDLLRHADLATAWMDHMVFGGSKCVDDLYATFGVRPQRRRCIPYGADHERIQPAGTDPARVRRELGIDPGAPVIGQVAYFYPVVSGASAPAGVRGRGVKGHEDFVRAACIVLESWPDARFVFVGDGWDTDGDRHRDAIRRLTAELEIDHAVIFAGRRTDVADCLSAFDVSVQCSLNDNYGGTLESLLMARPTIATRVGAMPEVVRHEQTGLLVNPGDPGELAAAMLRLIANPDLGKRLGDAGRDLILSGYTIDHTTRRIAGAYSELAKQRGLLRPPVAAVG